MQGYVNEMPYFQGFYGLNIFMNQQGNWELADTVENRTIADCIETYGKFYPAGRTLWKIREAQCGNSKNTQIILGLSSCKYDEFMCSDGQCIEDHRRCDTVADCEDQTDEQNCGIVDTPKGYLKNVPPVNYQNPNLPLPVNVTVSIDRFINIFDYKHTIDLELGVTITWQDSRLIFNNLKDNFIRNELQGDEKNAVWRPKLYFDNIQDGAVRSIGLSLRVMKKSEPLTWDYNSQHMSELIFLQLDSQSSFKIPTC